MEVLDQPQIAGAYGAGLLARDDYAGGRASPTSSDAATDEQFRASKSAGTPHCQDCDGTPGQSPPGTGQPVPLELQRNIR